MSYDVNVAVHAANWPSSAAVQTCMHRLGYPVALVQTDSRPFMRSDGLEVHFDGRRVVLDASAEKLPRDNVYAYDVGRPPDHRPDDGTVTSWIIHPGERMRGVDINDDLRRIGAQGVHFGYGDYVLTISYRSSIDEMRAGAFVTAGMIKCFGGYGFDMQARTHGGDAFADELAADARNDALWSALAREVQR